MSQDDVVSIELSRDKARAVFEWAHRFMETQNPQFTHPADAIAVDTLASELEWLLPEVRTPEYPQLLRSSRESVVAACKRAMEPQHAEWLSKLAYKDVGPDRAI